MRTIEVIFGSKDIEYLSEHLTVEQLRHEITGARNKLHAASEWEDQVFYEDFIRACQVAIDITGPVNNKIQKNKSQFESIESIKNRYDLVDYASQYMKLKKSGDKFSGLCPFHPDKKSASFFVYPDNTYHCFGCQSGGSIIDFVMQFNKVDIKTALSILSR